MTTLRPIQPKDKQPVIEQCLQAMKTAKQQQAVFSYMVSNPHSYTHVIARGAGCINVPDCVANIKSKIKPYGLTVAHYLPNERPVTRHGRVMAVHRWLIVERSVKKAAA